MEADASGSSHTADAPKTPLSFKRGDVVYLKSGGPPMTVVDIISDNVVECQWFWRGQFPDLRFYVEQLTPWTGEEGRGSKQIDDPAARMARVYNAIAKRNPAEDSG